MKPLVTVAGSPDVQAFSCDRPSEDTNRPPAAMLAAFVKSRREIRGLPLCALLRMIVDESHHNLWKLLRRDRKWGYVGSRRASPQCQPTTVRKDNNLSHVEHTITCCRLKIQIPRFGSRL